MSVLPVDTGLWKTWYVRSEANQNNNKNVPQILPSPNTIGMIDGVSVLTAQIPFSYDVFQNPITIHATVPQMQLPSTDWYLVLKTELNALQDGPASWPRTTDAELKGWKKFYYEPTSSPNYARSYVWAFKFASLPAQAWTASEITAALCSKDLDSTYTAYSEYNEITRHGSHPEWDINTAISYARFEIVSFIDTDGQLKFRITEATNSAGTNPQLAIVVQDYSDDEAGSINFGYGAMPHLEADQWNYTWYWSETVSGTPLRYVDTSREFTPYYGWADETTIATIEGSPNISQLPLVSDVSIGGVSWTFITTVNVNLHVLSISGYCTPVGTAIRMYLPFIITFTGSNQGTAKYVGITYDQGYLAETLGSATSLTANLGINPWMPIFYTTGFVMYGDSAVNLSGPNYLLLKSTLGGNPDYFVTSDDTPNYDRDTGSNLDMIPVSCNAGGTISYVNPTPNITFIPLGRSITGNIEFYFVNPDTNQIIDFKGQGFHLKLGLRIKATSSVTTILSSTGQIGRSI